MAWQALYVLKVDLYDREKMKHDATIETSLRWFVRSKSFMYHLIFKPFVVLGIIKKGEVLQGACPALRRVLSCRGTAHLVHAVLACLIR